MSVVELKPLKTRHTLKRRRAESHLFSVTLNGKKTCTHQRLLISERRSKVRCEDCNEELDPLEALFIIADRDWWIEHCREADLEHEEKRVSKVQSAAIICLYEAGITPEKFAVRWAKEHERRQAIELKKAPEPGIETKQGGAA